MSQLAYALSMLHTWSSARRIHPILATSLLFTLTYPSISAVVLLSKGYAKALVGSSRRRERSLSTTSMISRNDSARWPAAGFFREVACSSRIRSGYYASSPLRPESCRCWPRLREGTLAFADEEGGFSSGASG
ncbi:hypothetical protein MRX96_047056 [Rhipicephalus microplus]